MKNHSTLLKTLFFVFALLLAGSCKKNNDPETPKPPEQATTPLPTFSQRMVRLVDKFDQTPQDSSVWHFFYLPDGRLDSSVIIHENGTGSHHKYVYDASGRPYRILGSASTATQQNFPSENYHEYIYDASGHVQRWENWFKSTAGDYQLYNYGTYERNSYGQVIKASSFDKDGHLKSWQEYDWAYGNPYQARYFNAEGNLIGEGEYEYDSNYSAFVTTGFYDQLNGQYSRNAPVMARAKDYNPDKEQEATTTYEFNGEALPVTSQSSSGLSRRYYYQ